LMSQNYETCALPTELTELRNMDTWQSTLSEYIHIPTTQSISCSNLTLNVLNKMPCIPNSDCKKWLRYSSWQTVSYSYHCCHKVIYAGLDCFWELSVINPEAPAPLRNYKMYPHQSVFLLKFWFISYDILPEVCSSLSSGGDIMGSYQEIAASGFKSRAGFFKVLLAQRQGGCLPACLPAWLRSKHDFEHRARVEILLL
jgi:hypothetical protein